MTNALLRFFRLGLYPSVASFSEVGNFREPGKKRALAWGAICESLLSRRANAQPFVSFSHLADLFLGHDDGFHIPPCKGGRIDAGASLSVKVRNHLGESVGGVTVFAVSPTPG